MYGRQQDTVFKGLAGQVDRETYLRALLTQSGQFANGALDNPAINIMDQTKAFRGRHEATRQYDFTIEAVHAHQYLIILHLAATD